MKSLLSWSVAIGAIFLSSYLYAGVVSYAPIPSSGSDAASRINNTTTYTSAVYAGGRDATAAQLNEVTLSPLAGERQTLTGNGVTLSAVTGTLVNTGEKGATIQADGVIGSMLNNRVFNDGAEKDSEQFLVLDTAGLQPGVTYDLRIYIANASGQNRQVNLTFAGDGKTAGRNGFL